MLRTATLLTASLALLGGAATPAVAHMHHRGHSAMHSSSTPAERQQTADLNRQQLSQAQTGGNSLGTGSSGLTTEPTSYQRSPGSTSDNMNGSNTGTMNSGMQSGGDAQGGMKTPSTGTMGNPGGAATPPTTTNPGTP
ncbi:MAG: hypothetical protein ACJ8EL_02800 [Rhizomicrobium sp.]|jgi:hypothetical protein